MLTELHIRNYAIIKEVDISFNNNLNVITGETGAGKSIIMGALALILGERADTKSLLNVQEKCVVEGVFNIKDYALKPYFNANDLDYDETCILRREISPNGKTRAFINDLPVNLVQLKELGIQLVDIVSQHQTLSLNDNQYQLSLVDAIADNQSNLETYQQLFKQFQLNKKTLDDLIEQEDKARLEEDYLNFIYSELADAAVTVNEQSELEQTLEVLSNAEVIQQSASESANALSTEETGIIEKLRQVKLTLQSGAKHHLKLTELTKRIDSTIIELKDIVEELETIAEQTQSNPEEINRIETRLQLLFTLQKKHRVNNNQELLDLKQQLETKLQSLTSLASKIAEVKAECDKQLSTLHVQANNISERRKKAIPEMEKKINQLLAQVQMEDAKINIKQEIKSTLHYSGLDEVELFFAANKGSQFQPINKVASGGELSRLMLCIKSLISDKMALPTIVFDEIDTGISGETALKVSKVMKQHATKHQVIAITHLPQIASKADNHLYVYKTAEKNTTTTHIKPLEENERVEEIARMMHGANPSEKVLEAAKELINS